MQDAKQKRSTACTKQNRTVCQETGKSPEKKRRAVCSSQCFFERLFQFLKPFCSYKRPCSLGCYFQFHLMTLSSFPLQLLVKLFPALLWTLLLEFYHPSLLFLFLSLFYFFSWLSFFVEKKMWYELAFSHLHFSTSSFFVWSFFENWKIFLVFEFFLCIIVLCNLGVHFFQNFYQFSEICAE